MGEKKYKRIVVKVGSSTITHSVGKLNLTMIDNIVRQLVDLKNRGKEVILVTSGAIGAGMGELGCEKRPKLIPKQQAMAAIGQGLLIAVYNRLLREYGSRAVTATIPAGTRGILRGHPTAICIRRGPTEGQMGWDAVRLATTTRAQPML